MSNVTTESSPFEALNKYAVSTMADADAFVELRGVANDAHVTFSAPEDRAIAFSNECEKGEIAFMEVNYATDNNAKHLSGKRSGQWKFRTYLPKAYSSAKSELRKALEAGIEPAELGKTALARARTTSNTLPRTVEEKIADYTGKLSRLLAGIEDTGRRMDTRAQVIRDLST